MIILLRDLSTYSIIEYLVRNQIFSLNDIGRYIIIYLQTFIATFIALVLACILVEIGVFYSIGRLFKPLVKPVKLPPETAIPIATRIFSPTAFHGMLATLYKEGVVTSNEIITTIFISQVPQRIYHLLRFYLPIVLPVLGPVLGLYYIALTFIITAFYLLFGIVYGRITGRSTNYSTLPSNTTDTTVKDYSIKLNREVLKKGFKNGVKIFTNIAWRMAIAYVIVTILIFIDAFRTISVMLAPYVSGLFSEPSAAAISATTIISPLVALPMAGDMYIKGILGLRDCLIALYIGRTIFIAINDLPRAVPVYVGMYGTKIGTKVFILMEITSVISNLIVIAIILTFL